jgi:hypothetical protein
MITDGQVRLDDMENVFQFGGDTWYWNQVTGRLDIEHTGSNFPVMAMDNQSDFSDGDCLWLESTGTTAGSSTYVLFSNTYNGRAATFTKFADDGAYCAEVYGYDSTSEGLYVRGTIVSTVPFTRSVETSRGREPVFGVESVEPELVASGRARLAGGSADVAFDRVFTESVASDRDVRVTVTPIGGWSAIYVEHTGPGGFSVRSAAGETDIDFYWTAAGSARSVVDRGEITLPDPEEHRRIVAAKRSARG